MDSGHHEYEFKNEDLSLFVGELVASLASKGLLLAAEEPPREPPRPPVLPLLFFIIDIKPDEVPVPPSLPLLLLLKFIFSRILLVLAR